MYAIDEHGIMLHMSNINEQHILLNLAEAAGLSREFDGIICSNSRPFMGRIAIEDEEGRSKQGIVYFGSCLDSVDRNSVLLGEVTEDIVLDAEFATKAIYGAMEACSTRFWL
jgi:hypothetical protein